MYFLRLTIRTQGKKNIENKNDIFYVRIVIKKPQRFIFTLFYKAVSSDSQTEINDCYTLKTNYLLETKTPISAKMFLKKTNLSLLVDYANIRLKDYIESVVMSAVRKVGSLCHAEFVFLVRI